MRSDTESMAARPSALEVISAVSAERHAGGVVVARRVLEAEAYALLTLAQNLPSDFQSVVEMILSLKGRIIVSGMGKSGHIGRKIASTLASTGTPSFFVHPGEASHGDLGMVTKDDACLLISNSGETSELRDITLHCVRFGIPIIGVSKNPDSALMRAARFKLTLSDIPEACSIGMAPTTSTIQTLGLGDALAVALMEQRKFSPDLFRTFHPGGKLGAQLATVEQLMHPAASVPLVALDAPMSAAVLEMTTRSFGLVGVVDAAGKLAGVITDGDLRRNIQGLLERSAYDVCTKDPITVRAQDLAVEALAVINAYAITGVIVLDDEARPIGVLHIHDCLRIGLV